MRILRSARVVLVLALVALSTGGSLRRAAPSAGARRQRSVARRRDARHGRDAVGSEPAGAHGGPRARRRGREADEHPPAGLHAVAGGRRTRHCRRADRHGAGLGGRRAARRTGGRPEAQRRRIPRGRQRRRPRRPDGARARRRRARRALRRGTAAARGPHDPRVAARPYRALRHLDAAGRAPRPSARLPAQDQRVRRLGRADVGAVHQGSRHLRLQRHRAHPAALGRCGGQSALPAAADRHDGRDVPARRRVRAGRLDLVPGARQGLRRSETGGVRAQGVGGGVREAAAHRRHLRPRRRSRAHAAEAPDGAAREADGQPAQIPSEGGDVGLASGLHLGVDGRVLRDPANPSPRGSPASSSARRCATACRSFARRRRSGTGFAITRTSRTACGASTRCRTGTSRTR